MQVLGRSMDARAEHKVENNAGAIVEDVKRDRHP